MITVKAETLKRQIAEVYKAWGMPPEHAAATVDLMVEADLRGIDSHGIGMLPQYEQYRRQGRLNVQADIRVVKEGPTFVVIDADHGLGHPPGRMGMEAAIAKCEACGVGFAIVRNSNHYGAAGVYATMALERGLIGLSVTGTSQRAVVPTFAREPMFSTNPIAFAAPAAAHDPFSLDMATSTVAVGKLQIARRAGKPLPTGWALDAAGRPEHDAAAAVASKPKRMTPLGGTRELGSHKGYGLAMMVEVLGSVLSGSYVGGRDLATRQPGPYINVGHFFLALDPAFFRGEPAAFTADMDRLIDWLHGTAPADPAQPVLVPGDPEHASRRLRLAEGIPMTDALVAEIKAVARGCNAPFLLEG
ncbi:MAG: Ldh family oxidoreductase [Alphaproteobacteria bacterium]